MVIILLLETCIKWVGKGMVTSFKSFGVFNFWKDP